MNTACPHCSVNFEPEPGFYFGAMFVSYAINVAIFIAVWIAMYVLWNPEDWIYVLGISIAAILATPFTFRFSRVLWLYWFGGIRYEPRQ